MKTKLMAGMIVAALLVTQAPARADTTEPGAVVVDALLVRPVCLVSTVVGSTLFVLTLPVAAVSKSVKTSKEALVDKPARATFTRPLGDLDNLAD